MNKDWIKIYRSIRDNPLWAYVPYDPARAWIDLLLSATYKQRGMFFDGKIIDLNPGELITSQVKLSTRWGWNRKTVNKFLRNLQSEQMVDIKTDNKKTYLSIKNWNPYQSDGQLNGQLVPSRTDTNKKVKKVKNISKEIGSAYGNPLVNFVFDWFTQTYKHEPTDWQPRRTAYNLVQKAQTLIKAENPDFERMSLDDRTRGVLAEYFAWMKAQDWSAKVKTMGAVKSNFDVWTAKELGKGKYAS